MIKPCCRQLVLCFFFFQAEDGIRDLTVTGVQTCALPIWPRESSPKAKPTWSRSRAAFSGTPAGPGTRRRNWARRRESRRNTCARAPQPARMFSANASGAGPEGGEPNGRQKENDQAAGFERGAAAAGRAVRE